MTKSRPERIELNTPTYLAEAFAILLNKHLKTNAKLKRMDTDGKTTFEFYPTKGEYFIISMLFMAMAKQSGGELTHVEELAEPPP
jgi:hypothetical protein